MREMSVAEQRYKAVVAVIAEGRTVTEVARDWGVSRQPHRRHWTNGLATTTRSVRTSHWPTYARRSNKRDSCTRGGRIANAPSNNQTTPPAMWRLKKTVLTLLPQPPRREPHPRDPV